MATEHVSMFYILLINNYFINISTKEGGIGFLFPVTKENIEIRNKNVFSMPIVVGVPSNLRNSQICMYYFVSVIAYTS